MVRRRLAIAGEQCVRRTGYLYIRKEVVMDSHEQKMIGEAEDFDDAIGVDPEFDRMVYLKHRYAPTSGRLKKLTQEEILQIILRRRPSEPT